MVQGSTTDGSPGVGHHAPGPRPRPLRDPAHTGPDPLRGTAQQLACALGHPAHQVTRPDSDPAGDGIGRYIDSLSWLDG